MRQSILKPNFNYSSSCVKESKYNKCLYHAFIAHYFQKMYYKIVMAFFCTNYVLFFKNKKKCFLNYRIQ